MNNPIAKLCCIFALAALTAGCQADSRQQILAMDKTQVALRSVQSRVFETEDMTLTVRTVIATLQDLGFTVDKVDQTMGLVSATKAGDYLLKLTVTIRPKGEGQVMVRASAQRNLNAVSDAMPYQQFFDSLSQALFLEAHEVS